MIPKRLQRGPIGGVYVEALRRTGQEHLIPPDLNLRRRAPGGGRKVDALIRAFLLPAAAELRRKAKGWEANGTDVTTRIALELHDMIRDGRWGRYLDAAGVDDDVYTRAKEKALGLTVKQIRTAINRGPGRLQQK